MDGTVTGSNQRQLPLPTSQAKQLVDKMRGQGERMLGLLRKSSTQPWELTMILPSFICIFKEVSDACRSVRCNMERLDQACRRRPTSESE